MLVKIVLSIVMHSRDVNLFLNIVEIIIFKNGNANTNRIKVTRNRVRMLKVSSYFSVDVEK